MQLDISLLNMLPSFRTKIRISAFNLYLRTAQAKEYSLDKEQTSYGDLLDGLRLSLKGYQIN
jgi:hypothetical protein